MATIRRIAFLAAALSGFAARGEETPCSPESRKRLPSREELARLCPKVKLFASAPQAIGDPHAGCTLMFMEGADMLQVAAMRQMAQVPGGPKANAERAALEFGKMGGGKAPAVRRMPWKSIEAFALEETPGYFVDAGGQVVVVHVTAIGAKPPGDDCVEAIVKDVAKRFAAR